MEKLLDDIRVKLEEIQLICEENNSDQNKLAGFVQLIDMGRLRSEDEDDYYRLRQANEAIESRINSFWNWLSRAYETEFIEFVHRQAKLTRDLALNHTLDENETIQFKEELEAWEEIIRDGTTQASNRWLISRTYAKQQMLENLLVI